MNKPETNGYEFLAPRPKKLGGVNGTAVRSLLRKEGQERRSAFRAGRLDVVGFLLNLVLVGAIAALFIVFFGRFTEIYVSVKLNGRTDLLARANELLTILYTAVTVGMVIGGVGRIGRELFASDDMKIFSALPINPKTLFAAKLVSLYRSQFLIALIAVFTVNFTFSLKVQVSAVFWVFSLVICFLLPLITIAISALLVTPYQALKKFLRDKFVLLFLAVTALLGVSFWLYSIILGGVQQLLLGDSIRYFFNESVMTTIARACDCLYPARWFANIMTGSEQVLSWVWLLLTIAVCLVLSMFIIKGILRRALQARNESASQTVFRSAELSPQGKKLPALLKKEFLLIFRTPSYMFSYFSVAFVMPLMVYFCMDTGASLVENLVGIDSRLELALFLTLLFGALTNMFCATNISRDGEMFYSVKGMPVRCETVFLSKVLLCLIVTAISQVASAAVLFGTGNLGLFDALFVAVIGLLFGFVNIAVATRYDFNHAKFSTEDDGEIKESSGTVSTVVVMGIVLSFLVGGAVLVVKLLSRLNQWEAGYLTYLLAGAAGIVAAVLAGAYLLYRLKERYYEFSGGGI